MEWKLNKAIQVEPDADDADPENGGGKPVGHDSAEDARAAGELVRYKIMYQWANMKREGWTLKDGRFVAPKDKKTTATVKKLTVEGIESGSAAAAAAQSTGAALAHVKRAARDGTEEGELVEA